MKAIFAFLVVFALCAMADATSEVRPGIDRTISALNVWPVADFLFTADAASDLGMLPKIDALQVRQLGAPATSPPAVSISKEPWGEAQINLPGIAPIASLEVLNPRISTGMIRLLTPDVAVVEGRWTHNSDGKQRVIPLLFVMKRDGDQWRVASAHILAAP